MWGHDALRILLFCLCTIICADEFTNPSNSVNDLTVTYTLGQTVNVAWDTSLSFVTLTVSHWGGEIVGALLSDARNGGTFTWTIGQSDNIGSTLLASSTNFVLVLMDPTGGNGTLDGGWVNGQLQSRAFRIVNSVAAAASSTTTTSSTTSSTSSTSTSTSASSTSIAPITTTIISTLPASSVQSSILPTTSSSQSSTVTGGGSSTTIANSASTSSAAGGTASPSSDSPGLSDGAKIGIGVGVGCGVLAVVILGVAAAIFLSRRRRGGPGTAAGVGPHGQGPPDYLSEKNGTMAHATTNELAAGPAGYEAAGKPVYNQPAHSIAYNELSGHQPNYIHPQELGNGRY